VLLGAGLLLSPAAAAVRPPGAAVLAPLLAQHPTQSTLSLHYMIVPATFALVVAACVLKSTATRPISLGFTHACAPGVGGGGRHAGLRRRHSRLEVAGAAIVCRRAFTATRWIHHSRLARSFPR